MAAHNFSFTIHEGFAPVVARTRKALKDQGFGIISELDLAEMFRATLGRERRPANTDRDRSAKEHNWPPITSA